jgi:hypothetical protein
MKVNSSIRVGQLVKIKSQRIMNPNQLYLVVAKHGPNCELVPVGKQRMIEARKWWTENGLSVYA